MASQCLLFWHQKPIHKSCFSKTPSWTPLKKQYWFYWKWSIGGPFKIYNRPRRQKTWFFNCTGIPFVGHDLMMLFGRPLATIWATFWYSLGSNWLPFASLHTFLLLIRQHCQTNWQESPGNSWSTTASIHFPHIHPPIDPEQFPDRKDTKRGDGGDWHLDTSN